MSKRTTQQTAPTTYNRNFSLLVVLFILLIIIGTAYTRPYSGTGGYGGYGYY